MRMFGSLLMVGLAAVAGTAHAADIPANTGTSATLTLGEQASGVFEFKGDQDWWKIGLAEGAAYAVTTGIGSEGDCALITIYGRAGGRLSDSACNGRDLNGLEFIAPASGRFFVGVGLTNGPTSVPPPIDYGVKVQEDCAGSPKTLCSAKPGAAIAGRWQFEGDADWRTLRLERGRRYRVRAIEGNGEAAVYDRQGKQLAISDTSDVGNFTAAYTGRHYVAATNFVDGSGFISAYRLIVEPR